MTPALAGRAPPQAKALTQYNAKVSTTSCAWARTLLGPAATPVLAIVLPASFLLPVVVGLARAGYLRARRPEVYTVIGLGHTAVLARGPR